MLIALCYSLDDPPLKLLEQAEDAVRGDRGDTEESKPCEDVAQKAGADGSCRRAYAAAPAAHRPAEHTDPRVRESSCSCRLAIGPGSQATIVGLRSAILMYPQREGSNGLAYLLENPSRVSRAVTKPGQSQDRVGSSSLGVSSPRSTISHRLPWGGKPSGSRPHVDSRKHTGLSGRVQLQPGLTLSECHSDAEPLPTRDRLYVCSDTAQIADLARRSTQPASDKARSDFQVQHRRHVRPRHRGDAHQRRVLFSRSRATTFPRQPRPCWSLCFNLVFDSALSGSSVAWGAGPREMSGRRGGTSRTSTSLLSRF